MTRWLLKFTNLSVLDQANHGETPIHVASALGHYDSVKVCYIMYIYPNCHCDCAGNDRCL